MFCAECWRRKVLYIAGSLISNEHKMKQWKRQQRFVRFNRAQIQRNCERKFNGNEIYNGNVMRDRSRYQSWSVLFLRIHDDTPLELNCSSKTFAESICVTWNFRLACYGRNGFWSNFFRKVLTTVFANQSSIPKIVNVRKKCFFKSICYWWKLAIIGDVNQNAWL